MPQEVAYIKKKGREGQNPRTIYKGNRRARVAALSAEGWSQRRIAEELGIGKSTVMRDLKYIKSSEHKLRAEETAKKLVEEQAIVPSDTVPTSVAEFREQERANVIAMVAEKQTYEQVAKALGISIDTVVRHINVYLDEYGDFGGRTMQQWRNQQLIDLGDMMHMARKDMFTEAIQATDHSGDGEKGWDLTPYQAKNISSKARAEMLEYMKHQARLLQLLVNKTEVDIEHKVVVANLRGVDVGAFPGQNGAGPTVIDGISS